MLDISKHKCTTVHLTWNTMPTMTIHVLGEGKGCLPPCGRSSQSPAPVTAALGRHTAAMTRRCCASGGLRTGPGTKRPGPTVAVPPLCQTVNGLAVESVKRYDGNVRCQEGKQKGGLKSRFSLFICLMKRSKV